MWYVLFLLNIDNMNVTSEIRDTELGANVPNTSFRQLSSWDGAYFGCGNEFRDSEHGECGTRNAMPLNELILIPFIIRYSMRCTRTGRAIPPLLLQV